MLKIKVLTKCNVKRKKKKRTLVSAIPSIKVVFV